MEKNIWNHSFIILRQKQKAVILSTNAYSIFFFHTFTFTTFNICNYPEWPTGVFYSLSPKTRSHTSTEGQDLRIPQCYNAVRELVEQEVITPMQSVFWIYWISCLVREMVTHVFGQPGEVQSITCVPCTVFMVLLGFSFIFMSWSMTRCLSDLMRYFKSWHCIIF